MSFIPLVMAWSTVWATSLFSDESCFRFFHSPFCQDGTAFVDCTLRQQVRVTQAASDIRIRLSNEFSEHVLSIGNLTVAHAAPGPDTTIVGSPCVVADSIQPITFAGRKAVDVPPGATIVSDLMGCKVDAGADITISMYLPFGHSGPSCAGHEYGKTSSWVAPGDQTTSAKLTGKSTTPSFAPETYPRWYFLSSVEGAVEDHDSRVLVCFGDSITDMGNQIWSLNRYVSWPGHLSRRLLANPATANLSVLNMGIAGDRLWAGEPGGLRRLDRDLFHQTGGTKYFFILMGVNDIHTVPDTEERQEQLYHRLVLSFTQINLKARAAGIKVFASTILPFCPRPGVDNVVSSDRPSFRENTRLRINKWLQQASEFDYVVDWAGELCDKDAPQFLQEQYKYDFVHPNEIGLQAMAESIDLTVFDK